MQQSSQAPRVAIAVPQGTGLMEKILKFDSEKIVQALNISHDLDNVFHILMPTNAPEDRSGLRTPIVFRNNYREEVGGHESTPRWQLS